MEVTLKSKIAGVDPEIEVKVHVTHEMGEAFSNSTADGNEIAALRECVTARTVDLWHKARADVLKRGIP